MNIKIPVGWLCPSCLQIFSPTIIECRNCKPKKQIETSVPVWRVGNKIPHQGVVGTTSIDVLDLDTRTKNCLLAEDIKTVEQLICWNERELMKTPNLGRKSFKLVVQTLAIRGLTLKQHELN